MTAAAVQSPERIHPGLWRGTQLAQAALRVMPCGSPELAAELPSGGWPRGALTELLVHQVGSGELRLLRPVLSASAGRPVVLLQAPHQIQPAALAWWGLSPQGITVLDARASADALWAAEQVLRAGTCACLIFWATQIRPEALRRLQLAAQESDSCFFMIRPRVAADASSTAPLRLGISAARGGVHVDFIKRRGPAHDTPLFVPLDPSPILNVPSRHAPPLDRRSSPTPFDRTVRAQVVA